MGSVVAALTPGGMASAETARAMLQAAPHRGDRRQTEVAGTCAVGVSNGEGPADATLVARGGWVASLVGDLDNWRDLARELGRPGTGGEDSSPAGVVLRAFERWGEDAVCRFRGAFAGMVSDGKRMWCFRDQVGFQPLFYRHDGRAFYCGSEAKQVSAGAGLNREPDLDALEVLFYRGTGEAASLKGVKRFLSSALARVDESGRVTTTRYWDPSPLLESARIGVAEARDRLVDLLAQAVARTVRGNDVVTLSGGIDSPTVAAFAAAEHLRTSGRPLRAISSFYPDFPSVDESRYTQQVAEHLGIPLHPYVLTGSPLDDVESWTNLADGPWDTLPISQVAQGYRLARQLGARSVLTGELAEYVSTISGSLLGHLLWHGRWRALTRHARALQAGGASWASVGRRVAREGLPGFLGVLYTRLANRRSFHYPGWVDVTAIGGSPYSSDLLGPATQRWRRAQLAATQGTTATMEADEVCAALCGVRVRRPLADVDLWEFFLSLPAEVKFPDPVPKSLVRQAMRGRLPDAILDRRAKTLFDEYAVGTADYPALRRWIDPRRYRMRGVDYALLRSRLEQEALTLTDLLWAYDLARVHAFVGLWG